MLERIIKTMTAIWDENRIEQYITQGIEESLTLDYKAAGALERTDKKKEEVTKDVSAMANSDGGIIIYGIAEDSTNKHLPGKIDPIDRNQFSKEWLEDIISNIRPKIDGLVIYPVPISTAPNHVVYMVEIPQSYTAHQATDKRYYKRRNFKSEPMEDYEIRDVMGRGQYPKIELEFDITVTQKEVHTGGQWNIGILPETKIFNRYKLEIWAFNAGRVYAQYVNILIEIPDVLLPPEPEGEEMLLPIDSKRDKHYIDGILYYKYYDENTTRDIIGFESLGFGSSSPNYGPARHVPILPGRHYGFEDVRLRGDFESMSFENLHIEWEVFADNAPALKGRIAIKDIEIINQRNKTLEESDDEDEDDIE